MKERSERIRVLYLVHTMARGGSASSLRHLIEHLPRSEVEAHLLAPDGPSRAQFESMGVQVRTIPDYVTLDSIAGVPLRGFRLLTLVRAMWALRHTRTLRATIRELKPDLVHLNERGMLHAAKVAHGEGVPVVMHARSVADPDVRWYQRLWYGVVKRYVDRVIAIDGSVRRSLPEAASVDVVYNPLSAANAQLLEHSSDRNHRAVRFTYLSGLLRAKGIWDLLEAARLLRDRDDIIVHVAGGNPHGPAFYRSTLGRVCEALGLVEDVETRIRKWIDRNGMTGRIVLHGHVQDSTALFAQTDVVVCPTHQGAPSRSVFEAGVRGIPSIVAMDERVEDVVADNVTGILVPERSPAALAAAMKRLADDADLRLRLGSCARQRYVPQFNPDVSAASVLRIYRDVLASNGRARTTA